MIIESNPVRSNWDNWLKLWRIGLAPNPDILALLVDVSSDKTDFYATLEKKARELERWGLIEGRRRNQDSAVSDHTRYWLGPSDAVVEFEEAVKLEIENLKQLQSGRNYAELKDSKGYFGFRYWIVSDGQLALKEWSDKLLTAAVA